MRAIQLLSVALLAGLTGCMSGSFTNNITGQFITDDTLAGLSSVDSNQAWARLHFGEPDQIEHQGCRIVAEHYVFACGAGLEVLGPMVGSPPVVRRPLEQVIVPLGPADPSVFAHIVRARLQPEPEATITTHSDGEDRAVLYVGGRIATRPPADRLDAVRELISEALPGLGGASGDISTFAVDRIEPRRRTPSVTMHGNATVCIPVKLTLVPAVADQVMANLSGLTPTDRPWRGNRSDSGPQPIEYAAPPW